MRSFNERSGASSSEGGGEFECRVSTYLVFFLGGVILIPSGGSSYSKLSKINFLKIIPPHRVYICIYI